MAPVDLCTRKVSAHKAAARAKKGIFSINNWRRVGAGAGGGALSGETESTPPDTGWRRAGERRCRGQKSNNSSRHGQVTSMGLQSSPRASKAQVSQYLDDW
jgi:hypothetical protein